MIQNKKSPEVSVKIVFKCDNKVLYQKSGHVRDIPGGHIEFGETILGALKRELKEELGYDLKTEPCFLHAWSYISKSKNSHGVYLVYVLDLDKEIKFFSLEDSSLEFIWLDKEEIKTQNFLSEMEKFLIKAVSYKNT